MSYISKPVKIPDVPGKITLREIMKDDVYGRFLEKLEEPEMVTDPDGNEKLTGLDYSDVALALTQYRGAMTRFAADRLI